MYLMCSIGIQPDANLPPSRQSSATFSCIIGGVAQFPEKHIYSYSLLLLMHLEWRNGKPYVYRSERGDDGKPLNIYVAPLSDWYHREKTNSAVPPHVHDMMSEADWSLENVRTISAIKNGTSPADKAKINKAEKIAIVKHRRGAGGKFQDIADDLGISVSTAHEYSKK